MRDYIIFRFTKSPFNQKRPVYYHFYYYATILLPQQQLLLLLLQYNKVLHYCYYHFLCYYNTPGLLNGLRVRPGRVCTTKHCRSSKIISRDILLAIVSLSQRNILIANLSFIILITNENRIRFCFIIIIIKIRAQKTKWKINIYRCMFVCHLMRINILCERNACLVLLVAEMMLIFLE